MASYWKMWLPYVPSIFTFPVISPPVLFLATDLANCNALSTGLISSIMPINIIIKLPINIAFIWSDSHPNKTYPNKDDKVIAELKKVKSELTKITKELETVKAEKENLTKELETVKAELAKVNKK